MATIEKKDVILVLKLQLFGVMITLCSFLFQNTPKGLYVCIALGILCFALSVVIEGKMLKCPVCGKGQVAKMLYWHCPNYACPQCGEKIELR